MFVSVNERAVTSWSGIAVVFDVVPPPTISLNRYAPGELNAAPYRFAGGCHEIVADAVVAVAEFITTATLVGTDAFVNANAGGTITNVAETNVATLTATTLNRRTLRMGTTVPSSNTCGHHIRR